MQPVGTAPGDIEFDPGGDGLGEGGGICGRIGTGASCDLFADNDSGLSAIAGRLDEERSPRDEREKEHQGDRPAGHQSCPEEAHQRTEPGEGKEPGGDPCACAGGPLVVPEEGDAREVDSGIVFSLDTGLHARSCDGEVARETGEAGVDLLCSSVVEDRATEVIDLEVGVGEVEFEGSAGLAFGADESAICLDDITEELLSTGRFILLQREGRLVLLSGLTE